MHKISKADAITISEKLKDVLSRWGLISKDLRGVTGDRATVVAAAIRILNPVVTYIRCAAHFLNLAILWGLHLSMVNMKGDFVTRDTMDSNGKLVTRVVLGRLAAKESKKKKKQGVLEPGLNFFSMAAINKTGLISRVRTLVTKVKKSNLIHSEFERLSDKGES